MGVAIAGTAYLKVDGNQYPLKGSFVVSPSAVERAGIAGQDYVHGYSELPRVPYIEGDISSRPEISLEDMELITDATVTAELINGKVYVLRNAWCKSALELNTYDGQFRARFEGQACDEIS
ncbi:phage tail tube protein [Bradyrhizobium barranii subsp. barranii]|uniref:Phage tail tube protein n=1 Tax=Bradyrhizobium barranii subsp. barranii TaxID=2823807 RepID=A0A939MFD3_9BRAD|nr:phage tail tube protein [Bradyrhizobium barranii]UEM11736.1 phage tail tube protein [Bradyrhizobium barranii subsp. barranii]